MPKTPTKWMAYVPGDGNWDFDYDGDDKAGARKAFLKMLEPLGITSLSRGTKVFLASEMGG